MTIELDRDLEEKLRSLAQDRGQPVAEFARLVLEREANALLASPLQAGEGPRPSREELLNRIKVLHAAFAHSTLSSEDFMREKQTQIDMEEARFERWTANRKQ